MTLVLVSIAVLWMAPFLYSKLSRFSGSHGRVEKAVVFLLGIFVVIDILPASFTVLGWVTPALVAVGLLTPSLVERAWRGGARGVHWLPLLLGTFGLAFHAFFDGAALVNPFGVQARVPLLPFAIVVHRFFEGVFIWWALRPRYGWEIASVVLGLSASFTLTGYLAGAYYIPRYHSEVALAVFQAVVAGSLLHLALDRHGDHGHSAHDHAAGELQTQTQPGTAKRILQS